MLWLLKMSFQPVLCSVEIALLQHCMTMIPNKEIRSGRTLEHCEIQNIAIVGIDLA